MTAQPVDDWQQNADVALMQLQRPERSRQPGTEEQFRSVTCQTSVKKYGTRCIFKPTVRRSIRAELGVLEQSALNTAPHEGNVHEVISENMSLHSDVSPPHSGLLS